jgi:mannosyltransferase OCH1-like enzyme
MIPKIIHYCRFGGTPLQKGDLECINSWKIFHSDFKFMLWDESNFDLKNDYLEDLYEMKKWACYTEYVRYYALKKYGGIYFDTDIVLIKDLSELLSNDFFIGFETATTVGVSAIGSIANHPLLDELLHYYDTYKKGDKLLWSIYVTGPVLSKYKKVEDIGTPLEFQPKCFIYPPEYFYPMPYENADELDKYKYVTKNSYTLHLWNASWVDEWSLFWAGRYKTAWKTVYITLKRKPIQPFSYYKNLVYHSYRQIMGKTHQEA